MVAVTDFSSRPAAAEARGANAGSGRPLLLAALSGGLGALCWMPLGLGFLQPLAWLPMLLALDRARSVRHALLIGGIFSAARFAVGAHFFFALFRYSPLAAIFYLMAVAYAAPFGAFAAAGALGIERRGGPPRAWGFALLYALTEWIRSVGDLSFPVDLLAHADGGTPAIAGLAPWTGASAVSLLSLGVTLALYTAFRERRRSAAALALALWVLPALLHPLASASASSSSPGSLEVGIVQPFATIEEKRDRSMHPTLWARLESLTEQVSEGADLIVWPESARPGPVLWREQGPYDDPEIRAISERVGVPILYGAEIARVSGRSVSALYNGAAIVYPDGRPAQWYGKQRLLPFAEGVPFASLLGWDPSQRSAPKRGRSSYLTMMGNFSPGPGPVLFEVGEARIATLICYESVYPQLGRRARRAGANALVVLTNDAWWGKSIFAPWHFEVSRARALETRMPVLRAANSGVSGLVAADGRVKQRGPLGKTATLRARLDLAAEEEPPAIVLGDFPLMFAFVLFTGWWVVARRREQARAGRGRRPGREQNDSLAGIQRSP